MAGYDNRITVQSLDMRREKLLRERLAHEREPRT